jgi:CRISPR-associated protein Cmr2
VSDHLILVAIGPVQEFIAQARRTRDLWYGSHLLSELSRAGARHLANAEAVLIFPALAAGDEELAPCAAPLRASGQPPLSVANRLLAEIPAGIDPAALARGVRQAVREAWREMAGRARMRCAPLLAPGIDATWDEQVDSLLELTAAWAPLADRAYADVRLDLERAVAARRHLHDFQPWRHLRGAVPKSSLDGGRETVLQPRRKRDAALVRRYRIGEHEQLDAVGLIKRAGGEPQQFVPVVNTALACWVERAAARAPQALDGLRRAAAEVGLASVRWVPTTEGFPFDASVLLRSRWPSVFQEQQLPADPDGWGREHVGSLLDKLGEPFPYVACLVADGDRMGRAIGSLSSIEAHRAFSGSLAGFAAEARTIVEREHLGSMVYAGGDDVLAFLPLPSAVECADALRGAFTRAMAAAGLPSQALPTLSVGIGVGHVMEGMGDLLALGREAEQLAKEAGRNRLAVVVDRRSGETHRWQASWTTAPAARLEADVRALRAGLPMTKVHEIAYTLRQLPVPAASGDPAWSGVLAGEVRRSLARVQAGDAPAIEPTAIGLGLDASQPYAELHRQVDSWLARVRVARTFEIAGSRSTGGE